MEDMPFVVNGGVNEGMQGAAVFRLDVENVGADVNVGIESGTHRAARIFSFSPGSRLLENCLARHIH